MRGVYSMQKEVTDVVGGSSPHAWGLLFSTQWAKTKHRFIPTCVGFTTTTQRTTMWRTVHPHMRGVYCKGDLTGSQARRFIPTCVGFTFQRAATRCGSSVHPHMRGVYKIHAFVRHGGAGSSPHAWGLHSRKNGIEASGRFIPTCVGFT